MEYYVEPRSASDAELAGAIEIRPDTVSILGAFCCLEVRELCRP